MNATVKKSIEGLARKRLVDDRSHAICFRELSFDYDAGVLTIRGRLRSFYLKQLVQELLRNLDGVERIENRADVVSATGLSSERRD